MAKTYVACRPGFLQAAQSAFAGLDVEVDDNLTTDYEFRERDLGLADLLESELEDEEREAERKSDPKSAHTVIVPLCEDDANVTDHSVIELLPHLDYLVIRADKNASRALMIETVKKTKMIRTDDGYIQARPNIVALSHAFKKAGIKVHSISACSGGLSWMET